MYSEWYNSYRFAPVFMSLKKEENFDSGEKKPPTNKWEKTLQAPEEATMTMVSDAESVQSTVVKSKAFRVTMCIANLSCISFDLSKIHF